MKITNLVLLIISTVTPHFASAVDQPGLIMPINFFELSDKEKQIYVSGVLDGQMFMLYTSSHQDLIPYQKCAKTEGAKNIASATESRLALGDDLNYPTPWAISSAMGLLCSKYRDK